MPDYANTVIYKICCKNTDITDIYVGHTTNIKDRTMAHKYNCNNPDNEYYHYKVYEFIRNNGGFDNWEIIVIEEYPCNSHTDAIKRECELCKELKATLNIKLPQRSKNQYYSDNIDKFIKYRNDNKDILNDKAKTYYNENKEQITERRKIKIICECGCEIKKRNLSDHLKTTKHMQFLNEKHKEKPKNYSEEQKEYKAKWFQDNKERILKKQSKKVMCDVCNIELCQYSIHKHNKTTKHLANLFI